MFFSGHREIDIESKIVPEMTGYFWVVNRPLNESETN